MLSSALQRTSCGLNFGRRVSSSGLAARVLHPSSSIAMGNRGSKQQVDGRRQSVRGRATATAVPKDTKKVGR